MLHLGIVLISFEAMQSHLDRKGHWIPWSNENMIPFSSYIFPKDEFSEQQTQTWLLDLWRPSCELRNGFASQPWIAWR